MTGTPGHTALSEHIGVLPAGPVLLDDLPGTTDDLATAAARQLGWEGVVLPEMSIMGRRVAVVAELLPDVHAERICFNAAPVTDRQSVATWTWPEMAGRVPDPAVRIVGVLSAAKHWRTALAFAVPFARVADIAMVVPTSAVLTRDYLIECLPRARTYGVTVVAAEPSGDIDLDLPGRPAVDRDCPKRDAQARWIHEMVYEQLLATTD
ncbi:hypothetical protein EV193_10582 [Herbihabitans rhizosphaerae]|uniref:Uncharacterized protein n=1 Tax=Herbihabitans rhizosphaerae TaxID=1872711 RepID=A0A4Q7KMM1_9PSEU|nr:hypothetical protein [Herbihabitans rhizosphaerae]RZS37527.1 hypothetical protein EV193_10582 [Herbihabitans rhizosphaerae]